MKKDIKVLENAIFKLSGEEPVDQEVLDSIENLKTFGAQAQTIENETKSTTLATASPDPIPKAPPANKHKGN